MSEHDLPTRPLDSKGGRLLIGCVADNNPKYQEQALRLVQSIRWFGGELSEADILVCVIEPTPREYVEDLKKWGAYVRVVPFFSYFHHQPNKLRFLEMPEAYLYDTVVLLDCDTLVVQDFSSYISGEALQAKIADVATVSFATFQELFSLFGLPLPQPEYRCTFSNQPTIWYCNTGVLVFPQKVLRDVYPTWRRYTTEVLRDGLVLSKLGNFCEQASLTLAFAANPVPYTELPVGMNFPLHMVGRQMPAAMAECDPVIVHYHHLTDPSGFLLPTTHRFAQARIEAFNKKLAEYRALAVDGSISNQDRRKSSQLTSAPGSTHSPLVFKGQIVRQGAAERLRSRRLWRRVTVRLRGLVRSYLPLVSFRNTQGQATVNPGRGPQGERQLSHDGIPGSPVFVVGCIRSGTTILADLLGRHPDIVHCPFELKHVWSKVAGVPMASPKTGDRVCPQLGAEEASAETAARLSGAFAKEYRKNSSGKNAEAFFLTKNPHLCNKLPYVDRLFSDEARFIWIFRDLPSVVFSVQRLFASLYEKRGLWHYWPEKSADEVRCWHCLKAGDRSATREPSRFFPGGHVRFLAEYWLETNRAVSLFCGAHPKRSLAVREEDLVGQPERMLARVLAFLGVSATVPILYGQELDPERNSVWMREMDERDRSSLLSFVQEQRGEIDAVFPVENLASSYETILSRSHLGRR